MKIISAKGFAGVVTEEERIKVANSIARIVDELIPGAPPVGDRPIEIEPGSPILLWEPQDYKAANYRIRVGSDGGYFQRFTYELGHELGHVKLGSHRSNLLIEVCAEIVSLSAVKGIGSVWLRQPPYRNKNMDWRALTDSDSYIAKAEAKAIDGLPPSIREEYRKADNENRLALLETVRAEVEKLKLTDEPSRAYQHASAHLILKMGKCQLPDMLGLAMHTDPTPEKAPECRKDLPILPAKIPAWVPKHLR